MRSSTRAAIGIVSELVNVHSSLSRRIMTGDIVRNGSRGRFGTLFEGYGAGNL